MGVSQSKAYIVTPDDTNTVLVPQDLLSILHEHFPCIQVESMVVQTKELDVCVGRYVDIPADLQSEVCPRIYNLKVIHPPPRIEPVPEYRYRLPAYDIDDLLNVRVGKPVIYLFNLLPLNAVVRLSIVKSCSFSAIYPSVPIKSSESGHTIEWNVNTHEDHTMTDLETGALLSYLFWEAE
ncbi:uncharacterized protein ARMOST_18189 [Armillaria ostoyae]|uniref:Uncharacterized protein n=1 Tax=Armillaria ostoyae TaxID=47428 RepID=A0A284S126_ARMOS|nr:uncharacterized protein ARMOST_18189 [Armillaria ostoyae]